MDEARQIAMDTDERGAGMIRRNACAMWGKRWERGCREEEKVYQTHVVGEPCGEGWLGARRALTLEVPWGSRRPQRSVMR